jgi:hypothetical protein
MTLAEASHEFNAEQMTLNVRMLYFGIFSVQQYQKKSPEKRSSQGRED